MKKFFTFIFLVAVITVILGTIYTVGQQVLRQSANDPQIQMAEDGANGLLAGAVPADFMPPTRTALDITLSLSPFTMIFDGKGTLLESSANLHGQSIALPIGVFDYAKTNGENKFTWQPETGARFAVVLKYYSAGDKSGFVLVGRSLREVEIREDNLLLLVAFGWAVSMFFIAAYYFINYKYAR